MKIIEVPKNTLGDTIGLKPGDRLRKINGKRIKDEIDYRFRICDEHVLLDIEVDGKLDQVEVEKEYEQFKIPVNADNWEEATVEAKLHHDKCKRGIDLGQR